MDKCAISAKSQHHKWMKTIAHDLSSRSKFRIFGLLVEWCGEQPSTQCLSGISAFRMCWPFRSKSSTFRVLGKHGLLLILCICPLFYVQDCGMIWRVKLGSLWSDYGDRAGETAATSKAADPVPLRTLTTLTSQFRTVIKYLNPVI